MVLVALPALRDRLLRIDAAALAQPHRRPGRLEPLDATESVNYLRHRLRSAGNGMEDVLTEEALGILAAHGKGLPRLLNRAATLAFNLAAQAEADSVDAEAAEAVARLGLLAEEPAVLPHPTTEEPTKRAKATVHDCRSDAPPE